MLPEKQAEVRLERIQHRGQTRIALHFDYESALIEKAKALGCSWSQSKKCWHLPDAPHVQQRLFTHFKGVAWVDASALHAGRAPAQRKQAKKPVQKAPLAKEKEAALERFRRTMLSKGYSANTIATYLGMMRSFLQYIGALPVSEVSEQHVVDYNAEYIVRTGKSASFQRQAINAIKLFYNNMAGHHLRTERLQRVKKQTRLPEVLSLAEIQDLIISYNNIKHKCMIVLTYSCGLRRSEVLNLEWKHIDRARMLLHVRLGKGNKDRAVVLPRATLTLLEGYYRCVTPKPKRFVFEGQDGAQYSATSFSKVLKAGLRRAGIKKNASLHTLRHSYATHLHEQGTDILVLQRLLGHHSMKTTEIYTHISKKTLHGVKNPIEEMNL